MEEAPHPTPLEFIFYDRILGLYYYMILYCSGGRYCLLEHILPQEQRRPGSPNFFHKEFSEVHLLVIKTG